MPPTPDPTRLPLTVVGGYLGAGKTTLVNAVLRTTTARLAVLVNDFGAIDVDAGLVADHDGTTLALTNGCVCCSLADGFLAALTRVRATTPPVDHVLVEASGVADPAQVAQWGHSPGFVLDGVVVLVDAETALARAADRRVGDTVRTQVAGADLVLLTKTDLAGPGSTAAARDWVAGITGAPVLTATHGDVAVEALLGSGPSARTHTAPGVASHPAYATAAVTGDAPVSRDVLDAVLSTPPAGTLRAKGVVTLTDGPRTVHLVGRRVDVRPAPPGTAPGTRMVAIGVAPASEASLDDWLRPLAATGTGT